MFKTVRVDYDTLCWDNGVDFAPEYLYEMATTKTRRQMEDTKPINLINKEGTPPLRGVPYPTF